MNHRNRFGRIAKAATASLALTLGLTACTRDYTVAFVYMTSSKSNPGLIDQYGVDYQSGALTRIGSAIAAGNNPVTLVPSPDGLFLYVVNKGDASVQEFGVNGDGSLTSKNTYKINGSSPTAAAIDPAGKFLYVAFTYQTGYSAATPGPGGVAIFPVNSDHTLGAVTTVNVGNNPVSVVASYYNHFVYVLDQEASPNATILGFSQNTSTGALTPVSGTNITTVGGKTVATGYAAGVVPSAIAEDPTARFVYVTDQAANQLIGYVVQNTGALVPMVNGPFATGLFPVNLTVDPRGRLLYVVDYNANTVQGYAIDTATGTPSGAVGAFATGVGTGPTCVAIDPALGVYLYTSNNLDNTVTAEKLTPGTGALAGIQNSPFLGSGGPTCLTVVANGAHSTQLITP
ncbi:MAG: lactonase family protein [Acidobacteriota bacterium]|nr:lactonase family protein [Acidobacteriota bacterium]